MKFKRQPSGIFLSTLWIEESEFETIPVDALRRHGLLPAVPSPVNIELFVEREFGFAYQFKPMPKGRFGEIVFGEHGPEKILINERLDQQYDKKRNHLCRSTLAHECGHGLLHAPLFRELWREYHRSGRVPQTECEENRGTLGGCKMWWEYQANRVTGPLLAPAELLRATLQNTEFGNIPPHRWTDAQREALASHVSLRFDVSVRFARCRIARVFPAALPMHGVCNRDAMRAAA